MSEHNSSGQPITIRRSRPADAEAMAALFDGARAHSGTLQLPYASVEYWEKRLSNPAPDLVSLVAEIDGQLVGSASLKVYTERPRRRHSAGVGMAVHDDWQGQGIGTALMAALIDMADNWYNLRRVELEVFTDNAAGLALYRKFGFEVEGTLRDYAFRNGAYADAYVMSRLNPKAG